MNEELAKAKAEEEKKDPTGEMMDRDERRKLKAEKKKEKAEKKKAKLDDIDQAMAAGKLAERKKAQRKMIMRTAMFAVGGVFLLWVGYYLFKPYEESRTFAVCKMFLEHQVRYPQYLRYSEYESFEDGVRIWFTRVDPFGGSRMEPIRCTLAYDEVRGTYFSKITINRREVDPEKLEAFNRVLPAIRNIEFDLTRPPKLPDSLQDLQIQTDQYRFQLNIPGLN